MDPDMEPDMEPEACFSPVDALRVAIDELVAMGPAAHGDGASIEALAKEHSRLEAFLTRSAAEFDTSGEWAADGAQSAAAWIATRCRLRRSEARRLVRRGRALAELPDCEEAWSEGQITGAHVDVIAALDRPETAEALDRDEPLLVDQAATLPFESFVQAASYWDQLADPDGTEERAEARRARRDVYLAPSFGGMWLGKMTLDPVSGAIVSDELTRLEQALFEADRAEAKDRLGRDPARGELARTPSQRRADALVEMATRSKTAPADGHRPAPLFTVLVDFPTLTGRICELAQGTVVTPGSLLPWLEAADLERAVAAPPDRVEVSATARFFSGATRRAIELRDRRCTHPYCDRPAAQCQADHIQPFAQGGRTVQENGQLRCGFHNRLRNRQADPEPISERPTPEPPERGSGGLDSGDGERGP